MKFKAFSAEIDSFFLLGREDDFPEKQYTNRSGKNVKRHRTAVA